MVRSPTNRSIHRTSPVSVRQHDDDNDNNDGSLTLSGLSAKSMGMINTLRGDSVHGPMSSEELYSLLEDCEAGFHAV